MDDAEQVRACTGVLVKIYDHKTGTNQSGEWSIQRGEIKDKSGTIPVMFKDRDAIPKQWRGKELMFESHSGDRGLSGLYAYDDEYPKDSGKFTRMLKVTPTAEVYLAGDEDGRNTPSPPANQSRGQSRQNGEGSQGKAAGRSAQPPAPPTEPTPDAEATQARAILDAKKHAAKLGNLFTIAVDAVEAVVAPHIEKACGKCTPEQHQAAIGHIFGILQRDGYHDKLPVRPIAPASAKPPQTRPPEPPQAPPQPPPPRAPEPDDDEIPF